MATSGTTTFRLDVEEIITESYERGGVDAQLLTGYQARSARRSLNLLFSEWSVRGVNLWTLDKVSQALVAGTITYTLPEGTIDALEPALKRSGVDTELMRISLSEYQALPDKTVQGLASSYFIDRQYTPILYLWPVPENSTDTFEYWALRQMEDITASGQDADVPYRWTEAMCAGLASKLYMKRKDMDSNRAAIMDAKAEDQFKKAEMEERDKADLQIVIGT